MELSERFPDDLREAAKLSHPLEATDESGKVLTVKEFAKVRLDSFILNDEHSGSVGKVFDLELNEGLLVQDPKVALCCVLEQATLSTAYRTSLTQENRKPSQHD